MVTFHIITLLPDSLRPYLGASILGRAAKRKLVAYDVIDLRPFGEGKHKKVDDRPFGGGAGMVLMPDPIARALKSIRAGGRKRTILFSTRGKLFTKRDARRLAKYEHLNLICGRYEGVDERIASNVADEEFSVGDFVLSGGELPALMVADAVSRHVPGVLGKEESLEERQGSYPVYTRPTLWKPTGRRGKGIAAPRVLLSGDHGMIAAWRRKHGAS
jgi:tRNA (guanine37-N1)-methyltransferase